MFLSFFVPSPPVPFARAGQRGKQRFTPRPQADYMKAVRDTAALAMRGTDERSPVTGPVRVEIDITLPFPASAPAKEESTRWKTTGPDIDNYAKLICDAINAVVYVDDAQIVELFVRKRHGPVVGAAVIVTRL